MRDFLTCALLVVLCLVVFVSDLANEFVRDDEQNLTRNPAVAGGLTLGNIRCAPSSFHAGSWHPLTWVSHQLDVEVFGLNPAGLGRLDEARRSLTETLQLDPGLLIARENLNKALAQWEPEAVGGIRP